MAVAYTPGLLVRRHITLRKERKLPLLGDVLVQEGQQVGDQEVVARTELPGNVRPVNVANILRIPPAEVPGAMLVQEGDPVEKDQIIGEAKSFFGFFTQQCKAPVSGAVGNISHVSGQVLLHEAPIPVEVNAYLSGTIVDTIKQEGVIIETSGAFIQGIFGVGGETHGEVMMGVDSPGDVLTHESLTSDMKGKIVVAGAYITHETLEEAIKVGIAGLVVGGFDDSDLKQLLGRDLGVAITGRETIGLTMVITEGFGHIPMAQATFDLLKECQGLRAAMNGATQIRAGVIRPEIIVSRDQAKATTEKITTSVVQAGMEPGSRVRIIREPHFGGLGTVAELPAKLATLQSEVKVRVVKVKLDNGETITLPRANVEIVAGDA